MHHSLHGFTLHISHAQINVKLDSMNNHVEQVEAMTIVIHSVFSTIALVDTVNNIPDVVIKFMNATAVLPMFGYKRHNNRIN